MRFLAIVLFAASCSPYSPELGQGIPYLCGDVEPRCPEGYACMETGPDAIDRKCVIEGGTAPDAAMPPGFPCAPDGELEPNDSHTMPFFTDVGTATMRIFGPISICPEGDKDHFAIELPSQNGIEAVTTVENGPPVSVQILGKGGQTLGPSTMKDAKTMRACVANLPADRYLALANAGATVKQNYRITLKVVANCAM